MQADIERYSTASSRDTAGMSDGAEITMGAVISEVRKRVTKNGRSAGQQMAIATLEDMEGQIDATIFAESLADILKRRPDVLTKEAIVFVRGKVDKRREKPGLVVNDVIPIEEATANLTTAVRLVLPASENGEIVHKLKPLLGRHKGNVEVYVQMIAGNGRSVMIKLERQWSVRPTREMVGDLTTLLGDESVQLAGAGRRRQQAKQPLLIEESADLEVAAAETLVEVEDE
jgi:DNA polymerase-3 subunit alpha